MHFEWAPLPGLPWQPVQDFAYGQAVTIGQFAARIAEKYAHISRLYSARFSLCLNDITGERPTQYLRRETKCGDVRQQLETLNSDDYPGTWQLRLRVVVRPEDEENLREIAPLLHLYLFVQTANDFLRHPWVAIPDDIVVSLGALLVRTGFLLGTEMGQLTEDYLMSLESELGGYRNFLPPDFVNCQGIGIDGLKTIRAKLLDAMVNIELDSAEKCEMEFVSLLRSVEPFFGLHTFNCDYGEIDNSESGRIRLSASHIYFDPHTKQAASTPVCSLSEVVWLTPSSPRKETSGIGRRVALNVLQVNGKASMELDFSFPSTTDAENFTIIIDHHLDICRLASTGPSTSRKASSPADQKTLKYAASVVSLLPEDAGDDDSLMVVEVGGKIKTSRFGVRESWEIPGDEISKLQILGSGEYGEVWKGQWQTKVGKAIDVAIKSIKVSQTQDINLLEEAVEELVDEATLMEDLRHRHVVTLFGNSYQEGNPMIVMEFCPLGELKNFVMEFKTKLKETTLALSYVCQIAEACEYLHRQNIIHRDLAARNILVKTPEIVKVADFGLSRFCDDAYMITGKKQLPLKWMPPECIRFRKHNFKSDVWMYAVCAWEVLSYGKKPFANLKDNYLSALQRGVRLKKPIGCPQPIFSSLQSCWSYEWAARPDFSEIVEQIKAVLSLWPKFNDPLPDEQWRALGGGLRDKSEDIDIDLLRPQQRSRSSSSLQFSRSRPISPVDRASSPTKSPSVGSSPNLRRRSMTTAADSKKRLDIVHESNGNLKVPSIDRLTRRTSAPVSGPPPPLTQKTATFSTPSKKSFLDLLNEQAEKSNDEGQVAAPPTKERPSKGRNPFGKNPFAKSESLPVTPAISEQQEESIASNGELSKRKNSQRSFSESAMISPGSRESLILNDDMAEMFGLIGIDDVIEEEDDPTMTADPGKTVISEDPSATHSTDRNTEVAAELDESGISPEMAAELGLILNDDDSAEMLGLILDGANEEGEMPTAEDPVPTIDKKAVEEERRKAREAKRAARRAKKLNNAEDFLSNVPQTDRTISAPTPMAELPKVSSPLPIASVVKSESTPAKSVQSKPPVPAKKKPPPVPAKTRKAPLLTSSKRSASMPETSLEEEQEEEEEDENENDFSINMSPNIVSIDKTYKFYGTINWVVFSARPSANAHKSASGISVRIKALVQDSVRMKELGTNPNPSEYVPIVTHMARQLEMIVVETRAHLAGVTDISKLLRIKRAATSMSPKLQNLLENAAEASINFNSTQHASFWESTKKAATSLAVACVALSDIANPQRSGGYNFFKPEQA